MTAGVIIATVVCGVLCLSAGLAAIAVSRRRRPRRDAAVRAALYRALAQPGESTRIVEDLAAGDRKLMEAQARALLPALRGEDRDTLAYLLESSGATVVARRRCRSRRAGSRAAACQVLGDVGSPYSVLDLVPLLDDPRSVVRLAAARALGRLGQPSGVVPLLQAADRAHPLPVEVAAEAIHGIRDWPVSLLDPCLSDPSERTRALAVELLGSRQATDHMHALIRILENDPSVAVRVRAARALGRIGSPDGVVPLITCVNSGSAALELEAVGALGRLGAVAAVPILHGALLGSSGPLSHAAATALSAISPDGVAALQEVAGDHRHPASRVARSALSPPPTPIGRGPAARTISSS